MYWLVVNLLFLIFNVWITAAGKGTVLNTILIGVFFMLVLIRATHLYEGHWD